MTRTFLVSARYRRHIEAALALAISETARDAAYRADEDPRIHHWAQLPIDPTATGMVTISVEVDPNAAEPASDFSHFTRVGDSLAEETVAG